MTEETAESPDAASDDDSASASDAGVARTVWRRLVAAGGWFADTFRGHSGANQFEKREK